MHHDLAACVAGSHVVFVPYTKLTTFSSQRDCVLSKENPDELVEILSADSAGGRSSRDVYCEDNCTSLADESANGLGNGTVSSSVCSWSVDPCTSTEATLATCVRRLRIPRTDHFPVRFNVFILQANWSVYWSLVLPADQCLLCGSSNHKIDYAAKLPNKSYVGNKPCSRILQKSAIGASADVRTSVSLYQVVNRSAVEG